VEIIKFSYNWNGKLCNKAFTTIRLHNPRKYIKDNVYNIELNNEILGQAKLIDIKTITPANLNNYISFLDTGYSPNETQKILTTMYKNVSFERVLFDFCLLNYCTPILTPSASSLSEIIIETLKTLISKNNRTPEIVLMKELKQGINTVFQNELKTMAEVGIIKMGSTINDEYIKLNT